MPTTGANIVGPSSAFDQSDWLRANPAFLNGKKSLYLSWTSKSDVSGSNNSVGGVGQVATSAAMFFRHNTGNSAAPAAWLIGYTFSDRSVQYKSPANSGADNRQQRIAFQIQSGAAPQMWIDGVLQTPNAIVQDPAGAGYPTGGLVVQAIDELWIGRAVHGLWDGLIDEVRIIEDIKDTNYALTEFRNLNNIDDFVVFGDTETPSSALSPRGELVLAETTPGTKVRIKVDTLVVNPNPSSVVMSAVSVPTVGTAVKVDDSYVDFTPTAAVGTSRFTVTFTSGGKSITVPVVVNITGTVSLRPPDITDISLLSDRVAWEYTPPAGFEGYQPREGPDGATWATATNVGGKTTNKYVMKSSLLVPSKKVLVKPYANGLEALNAAEISLIEAPVTPGNYWSSPNYGTKTKNDVNNHTELMNAISGINPANAYINMTYTDSTLTTISKGGTSTHPLIITAQAPNGLTNFTSRPGFSDEVTVTGNYVWLDRLKFKVGFGKHCIALKGGAWKFITRCQVDASMGIVIPENNSTEEWWIGFNQFLGLPDTSQSGQSHVKAYCTRTVSTNPRKGRVYYNTFVYPGSFAGENACIMSGDGLDADGAIVNVNDSWCHYNFINNDRSRKIYFKHGMDIKYNDVRGSGAHSIALRGACIGHIEVAFNRITGKMLVQGPGHKVIGNITNDMEVSVYQQGISAGKPIYGADGCRFIGNNSKLMLGLKMTDKATVYGKLKNTTIEAHTGAIVDNDGTSISFGGDGRPVRDYNYVEASSTIKRSTTSTPLETPPTLSETICGPGSTRGKVWGT